MKLLQAGRRSRRGTASAAWTCALSASAILPLATHPTEAQTIVGPSPPTITTTTTVTTGSTLIVGNTAIATTGATNASNVTGGLLTVDTSAGPAPGPISIQSVNGNALQANGGAIAILGGVNVQTQGGHAVLANGAASSITINGASITTTGVGAALVAIGGSLDATGVTVNNTASAGPIISAGHGAVAEAGGTIVLRAGTSITTAAFNAVGLGASGAASRVTPDVLIPVTMNGRGAMGVYLHDGGQVTLLPGSTLQMNGASSVGIAVDNTHVAPGTLGRGLTVNLDGVHAAGQAGSTGLVAFNGASVAIQDLTVQGANAAAGAWARPGSSITLTGQSLISINAPANPTYYTLATAYLATVSGQVSSIFNVTSSTPIGGLISQAGVITSTGTTVNVTSAGGVGAYAGMADSGLSLIDLTDNTIVTSGANSFGIEANSNGQITGRDSRVTTSGGGAALFVSTFNGPGSIDLTNSTVLATGANTSGLYSLNLTPDLVNIVRLSGGSLTSTQSIAIGAQGPLDVTLSHGAVAAGGNGILLDASANDFGPQPTFVRLNASGQSVLTGDARADAASRIDIGLSSGAHWTGAALDITNATVEPTAIWTVTANSTVRQDVANAGLTAFTAPSGDPTQLASFKTLTMQNYVGAGGTLGLNTHLGTDGSASDRLIINGGTASGGSALRISNAGGAGALTTGNGILVVDTINGGTTAGNAFGLGNRVVAGPYEYLLYRSSVDATNTQAWYLRSTLDCTLEPGAPQCQQPVPPDPPGPNYRPETSLYAALPAMALGYGRQLLDTLHERVGEERPGIAPGGGQGMRPTLGWARVIALRGDRLGSPDGIFGAGPKYNYDIFAFQAGIDLYRAERDDGGRDHAGVYGAVGQISANVTHFTGRRAGTSGIDAYTIGGYWTRFGAPGWYLDAIAQLTWNQARANPINLPALSTSGAGLALSIEGGYPFRLDHGWIIEPQAQLIYQTVGLATVSDGAATVRFRNAESLAGRLGLRVARTWAADDSEPKPRLITAWLRGNLWHEFRGTPLTEFSSEAGYVPFRANLEGSWAEINAGVDAQVMRNVSLVANAGYQIGLDGRSHAYSGKLGLRVNW